MARLLEARRWALYRLKMMSRLKKSVAIVLALAALLGLVAWLIVDRLRLGNTGKGGPGPRLFVRLAASVGQSFDARFR